MSAVFFPLFSSTPSTSPLLPVSQERFMEVLYCVAAWQRGEREVGGDGGMGDAGIYEINTK